ncbi:MAG: flagellar export protein FliJ [Spirochaetales bacterium]|nr:flagellar export protein FliJ [Spirochaetales bacterium]
MKAFRFKLERILALRKHREHEWEIKLAEITGKCVKLMREIEERKSKKTGALLNGATGTEAEDYLSVHRYMARLDQEIQVRKIELESCERKRERVQAEYLRYSRERKVLDNLKEKRKAEYLGAQKVEEVKQIDDINTVRAARVLARAADRES